MFAGVPNSSSRNRAFTIAQAETAATLQVFSTQIAGTELPGSFASERADANWMVLDAAAQLAARCSLWWKRVPAYQNDRLGVLGHFAATSAAAASLLLHHACDELAANACTLAVGPMDGSTWRRYRFITERGSEPTFFLEPDNPDEWVGYFREAGFSTLAGYHSGLCTDLARSDPRVPRIAERVRRMGIELRRLRPDQFEQELRHIFPIVQAFSRNPLFSPLTRSEFMEQYLPIAAFIRPELVLIAEVMRTPVGFVFCVPDMMQARRGSAIDTVIVKTLAVAPEVEGIGLGALLLARANEAAAALGYRRAIYALMHEHNSSRGISRRYGTTMRRYELFANKLEAAP